jgi:hypothetical protein
MQEELLMRYWIANHDRFSTDFHAALKTLGTGISQTLRRIRHTYGMVLRGGLAGAITLGLWTTVLIIATPATGHAKSSQIELAIVLDSPIEPVVVA